MFGHRPAYPNSNPDTQAHFINVLRKALEFWCDHISFVAVRSNSIHVSREWQSSQEDLVKFGYKPQILIIILYIWLLTGSKYSNLANFPFFFLTTSNWNLKNNFICEIFIFTLANFAGNKKTEIYEGITIRTSGPSTLNLL